MIKADNQNLRRYAVFPITQETKNLEEFARDYLKKGGKNAALNFVFNSLDDKYILPLLKEYGFVIVYRLDL